MKESSLVEERINMVNASTQQPPIQNPPSYQSTYPSMYPEITPPHPTIGLSINGDTNNGYNKI